MAKKPPKIWAKIKLKGQLLTNNSYNGSQVQNGTWPQCFDIYLESIRQKNLKIRKKNQKKQN